MCRRVVRFPLLLNIRRSPNYKKCKTHPFVAIYRHHGIDIIAQIVYNTLGDYTYKSFCKKRVKNEFNIAEQILHLGYAYEKSKYVCLKDIYSFAAQVTGILI